MKSEAIELSDTNNGNFSRDTSTLVHYAVKALVWICNLAWISLLKLLHA
jgi:hypothetical protein